MTSPVLQVVQLGAPPWPTLDPFLFCVHHVDAYPAGNERLGPDAPLEARDIGQDFSGLDGWNMYHGSVVPGFPSHPHRGFETVTYARRGFIDHSDSLGAAARFGQGDVQWLTAGGGIVHAEMFPLVDSEGPNPLELFQIWLNLPAEDKMVDPYFTMLWDAAIPKVTVTDEGGRTAEITVIAGALPGAAPPAPPPNSWASQARADVAIWHVRLEPGASWELPAASGPDVNRVLYVFDGEGVQVDDTDLALRTAGVLQPDAAVTLSSERGGDALILQGRPIGEPVARYGPFVMNTEAEIRQAMEDYNRTGFGGWPFLVPDPNHGRDRGRFARHADGTEEEAPVSVS